MEILFIIFYSILIILLVYGLHSFVLIFFYLKKGRNKDFFNLLDEFPSVTIQLPVYNENTVIDRLLSAVCRLDYPIEKMQIQVLDDSNDGSIENVSPIIEKYKEIGFNIELIHRENRKGFKAGALKNGMKSANGMFIAIFDADFIPHKDFLLKTLPYFINPDIALVQASWSHYNCNDSILTKVQDYVLNGHFTLEQFARNKAGYFITFDGTCGVWRKEAIMEAGNWQSDTLAEDLDLCYRVQLNNKKVYYLNEHLAEAELPSDTISLKKQQFRWVKGTSEAALKHLGNVFKSDFSLKQKIESFFQLTSNFVYPLFFLTTILTIPVSIFQGDFLKEYNTLTSFMPIFYLALISSIIFYFLAQNGKSLGLFKKTELFPLLLAGVAGLSVSNTKAVLEALIGKKSEFERTKKHGKASKKVFRFKGITFVDFIEVTMALYFFIAIIISIYRAEYFSLPFQVLFFIGFAYFGFNNFRRNK